MQSITLSPLPTKFLNLFIHIIFTKSHDVLLLLLLFFCFCCFLVLFLFLIGKLRLKGMKWLADGQKVCKIQIKLEKTLNLGTMNTLLFCCQRAGLQLWLCYCLVLWVWGHITLFPFSHLYCTKCYITLSLIWSLVFGMLS